MDQVTTPFPPSDMEIIASDEYCRMSCEYPASIDEYEAGFVYGELTWGQPVAMGPFSARPRKRPHMAPDTGVANGQPMR